MLPIPPAMRAPSLLRQPQGQNSLSTVGTGIGAGPGAKGELGLVRLSRFYRERAAPPNIVGCEDLADDVITGDSTSPHVQSDVAAFAT